MTLYYEERVIKKGMTFPNNGEYIGTVADGGEVPHTLATDANNCLNPSKMESRAGFKGLSLTEVEEVKKWFVMRDLKRCNAKLPGYKLLEQHSIEVYTPKKERLVIRRNKKMREVIPVLHDLLFAHDTYENISPIVDDTPTLQFRFLKGRYNEPMVVTDRDMENFIQAGEDFNTTHYYAPEELTPKMLERRVRIIGGPFDQREGTLITTRGSKTKRLLVGIPSLIYKSVEVHNYDYIELL